MFKTAVCRCSCPYVFCFHVRSHVKYSFLCPQLSTDMDADVDFDSYKIGDRAQDIDMKFDRDRGHRHRRGQTTDKLTPIGRMRGKLEANLWQVGAK